MLDAVRLGPDDDETEITAGQVRDVVAQLPAAWHWRDGDPALLVVFHAGYDVTRLAWLLDLEHTFRLFKQVLGWTAPKIRNPAPRHDVGKRRKGTSRSRHGANAQVKRPASGAAV